MKKKHHHHRHHPSDKITDCGSKKHPCCKPTLIGDFFEKLAETEKKFLKTMYTKGSELSPESQSRVQAEVTKLQGHLDRLQEESQAIESILNNADEQDNAEESLTEKTKSLRKMLRQVSKKRPEPVDTKAVKAFLKSHNCSKQRWEKHQHDIDKIQQSHSDAQ